MNSIYRLVPVKSVRDKKQVINILEANNLPVSDLDESKKLFILTREGVIIGTAGLEVFGKNALLRSVSVIKKEQGKGLGRKINREMEQIAKDSGVDCLYLLTTTAKNFFSKEGYEVTDRQNVPLAVQASSEFTFACPSSAVAMKKNIL